MDIRVSHRPQDKGEDMGLRKGLSKELENQ